MLRLISTICLICGLAVPAAGEPLARELFGAARAASAQAPSAIGTYARGCGAGLELLPETGATWQAMRLSRNRNWGHPEMIAFLKDLSAKAAQIGWAGLYIGDISQPRGGPMTGGHASHQIGLDADIWLYPPRRMTLSRAERESLSSVSVRTEDQRNINGNWTRAHHALLRAAASDPRVDRIFIAAAVKIEMCRTAKRADRDWLQKIRPIYGHNTHFHVRLKCPAGAGACKTQTPTVADLSKGGDGCDETLQWWVTDYLNPPKPTAKKPKKPEGPPPKSAKTYVMSDLPRQCSDVLSSR